MCTGARLLITQNAATSSSALAISSALGPDGSCEYPLVEVNLAKGLKLEIPVVRASNPLLNQPGCAGGGGVEERTEGLEN